MNEIRKALNDSAVVRWGVILLISFTMGVSYYFYDVLSSIKSVMQTELKLSSTDYGLIVSFYSFPNTFLLMAVLGGIILDRWGIRKTGMLFVTLMTLGSFITAYGACNYYKNGGLGHNLMGSFLPSYSPELKMMMLGRLFFGLGAETFYVVVSKAIVKWFKGRELALAFGINLAIARAGTALALISSPILVGEQVSGLYPSWTNATWLGAMLMAIGFLTFLFYMIYDLKFDRQSRVSIVSGPDEKFEINDVLSLFKNKSFIYIALLCVTFYSAVFPFLTYAPDLMHNKFGLDLQLSGKIASILPFGTVLFTPIFGWFVDIKGKSSTLMILGSILLILVHLTLSLTTIYPYIAIFVLGIAFSLIPAAMWPAVSKIVEEKRLGTAYGLMFSIQNLGLFSFPILAGKVLDITNASITPEMIEKGAQLDYTVTVLMFAGLGLVGLLFAFLLKREDKFSDFGLELPNKNIL
ncbi:MAG: MFS transporter [Bacteroidia bacterium]|nr:MFS transporter [Bacteroidia bacterium]